MEGCFECDSLFACRECDEENGYVLNKDKRVCEKEGGLLAYQIGLIAFGCAVVIIVIIIYAGKYLFNCSICEVCASEHSGTTSFRKDAERALIISHYFHKPLKF